MDPQQAYADAAATVSDPDHAGYLLYCTVVKECHAMTAAVQREDWAALVRAGTHAQQILAALHDLADPTKPHGDAFRVSNRWAWTEVQQVVQRHEADRIDPVRAWAQELADQLYRRFTLTEEAVS